jgi:hypothetical protein
MNKKIILSALLISSLSGNAQLLDKIASKVMKQKKKENTEKVSENTSSQTTTASNPNFTYLNNQQAATKYGTKIGMLPAGHELIKVYNSTHWHAQYWTENNILKYFYTSGVYVDDTAYKDIKTTTSDGKVLNGLPSANNLPLSNPKAVPAISGCNSYNDETSEHNYFMLSDNEAKGKVDLQQNTGADYRPSYVLTISGKKMGSYSAMPIGIMSQVNKKSFWLTSTLMPGYDEMFFDGKSVYKTKNGQVIIPSGKTQFSSDGTIGVMNIMQPDNMDANNRLPFLFTTGKLIPPFNDDLDYKILNSGELLAKLQTSDKSSYILNGKTKIVMPEATDIDFFSNQTATKWASYGNNTTYFSDGTAIKDDAQRTGENVLNPVQFPKKVEINNKSYLVWLQTVDQDIYLCKKEL